MTAIPDIDAVTAARSAHSHPSQALSVVGREWLRGLVALLGIYEILLAVSARPVIAGLGVASGLLVAVAPWVARRSTAVGVASLIAGTIPFAVLTWWSILVPVVALLALTIGVAIVLRPDRRR